MLKLIIFVVILFILLYHFRTMEKETENFVSGIEELKVEHFTDDVPDINNLNENVQTELVDEDSYSQKIERENNSDDNMEQNLQEDDNTQNTGNQKNKNNQTSQGNENISKTFDPEKDQPVCQSKTKSKTSDCMFGCPDEESKEPQRIGFDEMVLTIEETEKICDLIEEKDRTRKEKEDHESLKKQLELNRKFLIQQKAQDKQIQDLEELVKSMQFTHEMNEAAVSKCGKKNDKCLTAEEKQLKQLLLEKEKQRKQVKININLKDFGNDFLEHLLNKMKLSDQEMKNLLDGVNSGRLNMNDLKQQVGFESPNLDESSQGYMNDSNCSKCQVDLSEYIDRCKIPCYKCRDPKWNCPQDNN